MPTRFAFPAALVALAAALVAVGPAAAQQKSIYRDGFAGKNPSFVRGDANVPFQEKDHKLSDEHCKSLPTSEYIKIEANPPAGAADTQFVHYYYETPPAPVTDRLTARLHVKAYRAGVQVKARLVLPKEKDPRNPDAPLTTLIAGDTYTDVRQWQALGFGDIPDLINRQRQVLHARLGRAVDLTDAYIDRIVVNVFAGPGVTEVWLDDLEIGPVRTDVAPPPPGRAPAATAGRPGAAPKGVPVEFADGQILVDGEPFFMLAIRHSGTPLKTLRDARFNTVWFPDEAQPAVIDEAIRHGFWIVPTLPLPAGGWDARKPKKANQEEIERDATTIATYLRRFLDRDAVLMWDLGGGRTAEDLPRVARASDVVRTFDPRRPRAVDLWDGFSVYSSYVNAIGAHRWPLFSSLEMAQYREWLAQRRALIEPGILNWTWVQTHMPEWFLQQLCGRPDPPGLDEPVGPHPEQIRILTYLSLAAGHRALGFWSDKFLENPFSGRDRLLELAMLNSEVEMLKPVLLSAQDPARWEPTSDPNVQAAVIRGTKEVLVLPVWMGYGTQYTPAQAAVPTLTFKVPGVPDGSNPWLITPVGVSQLTGVRRVPGGTEVTVPEFDVTAAVVFTSDLGPTGKVVRWQDHTRAIAPLMARYAQQQAIEQYHKAERTHARIVEAGGPDLPEAGELFARSRHYIGLAKNYADNNQYEVAYREARRALRPLRVLMRADWQKAVESLDVPTASPFAVSFYTLPEHWKLAKEVGASRPAGNGFANGGFELSKPAPDEGAAVSSLPGWQVRKLILDRRIDGVASIINTNTTRLAVPDKPPQPPAPGIARYGPQRAVPPPIDFRQPELGRHCLMLFMDAKPQKDPGGQPLPPPLALERAVLAVDSPPAEFAPGSLVRVSFWVKVPNPLIATADGLVVFDTAGGEPLGVRVMGAGVWTKFHLYRRVPASGKIAMTFALTGLGVALIDDVRIEPMVPFAAASAAYCPPQAQAKPLGPVRQASATSPAPPPSAQPAGYRR